jgi:predicted nucleotidyltransferase
MTLSRQHIDTINEFLSGLPVKKAYLFGSYSRDEASEDSDIDILVELDHSSPIGMKFFSYADSLQAILHGLSKYVKPIIDKEKVLIYER